MSQHIIAFVYKDEPLEVRIGWDAPMERYYVTVDVEEDFPLAQSDDGNRYSNLCDKNNDGSLPYQVKVLRRFGFAANTALVEALQEDCRQGVVNVQRKWSLCDAMTPCGADLYLDN